MPLTEPWSKKHKRLTRASSGGVRFSLSNSFAQPTSHSELLRLTRERGDHALLEAFETHDLTYTPNGGSLDLREEVAALYGRHIGVENVLVFAGCQVTLQTAAFALTNSHTHAIVFNPAYQSTAETPLHAGSQVTTLPLRASKGWQLDVTEVKAAIRDNTRYIIVNQPYNPAGVLMKRETQRELAALARAHGIYILSDEVYRLLEHDPKDRLPAMADLYERGLSAVTLSKPWGACGVSIGWLVFQDLTIKQRLVDVQYFGTACCSRASELQAIMCLRASDTILQRNLAIIRRNFGLLEAFILRNGDLFSWVRPTAGAIAFINFKGPLSSSELGQELADAGIGIKPAYCFSDVVTEDLDYFRVGYGEDVFPDALEALQLFVDEHRKEWESMARPPRQGGSTEAASPIAVDRACPVVVSRSYDPHARTSAEKDQQAAVTMAAEVAAAVVVAAEGRVFALGALAGAVAVAAATSLFLAAPFRRG